jgi:hypothetical protein
MSLSSAKPALEQAILNTLEKILEMSKKSNEQDVSSQIRKTLAKDLASAIDDYVKSADVNISSVKSIVLPGVTVVVAGPSGPCSGGTTAQGEVVTSAFGKLQ